MKAAGDGSGLRRPLKTDVVVIGGGATGAGVARDLALRGLKVILVERRDLSLDAERVSPDFVVSECEGCRMQIEHGSGLAAVHPIEILARALSISVSSPPSSASKAP